MSRMGYALVNGEESGEPSPGNEDGRSDESFSGKGYGGGTGDVPNTVFNVYDQNAESQRRRQDAFTVHDYQQLDFASTLNEQPHSQPFYTQFGQCWKNCCDPSKGWRLLVKMVLAIIAIIGIGGLVRFIFIWSNPPPESAKVSGSCTATPYWKGWQSINYAFAFGDSWTSTAFNYTLAQPSPSNPLGNPPFPGITSSNATNWIGYLTGTYNASLLMTYNIAVSGTTLDNHITNSYPVPATEQIYQRFMPKYAEAFWTPWSRNDTLFIMFVGINDVMIMNPVTGPALADIDSRLENIHFKLLSSLYGTGARNFLLLNVPPLERTWHAPRTEQGVIDKHGSDARAYNARVERVAGALKTEFKDANVFLFDVHSLFNQALDNPKRFKQLGGILNTKEFCPVYALGTPTPDYFDPVCKIPVNQYFWLNGLHPTYPVHDVLADQVVKLLKSGPNIC